MMAVAGPLAGLLTVLVGAGQVGSVQDQAARASAAETGRTIVVALDGSGTSRRSARRWRPRATGTRSCWAQALRRDDHDRQGHHGHGRWSGPGSRAVTRSTGDAAGHAQRRRRRALEPDDPGTGSYVLVSGGAPTLEGLVFDGMGFLVEAEAGCHANFGPTGCNPVALDLDGTQARVVGNTFIGSGEIRVHGGASPLIEGNDLSGASHILLEEPGDDTVVRANDFHDLEKAAIVVWSTGRPLIEDNAIEDVGGAAIVVGLQLAPGIEPTIRGNSVARSSTAIEVASGTLPTIEGNSLEGNTSGIVIVGSDAVVAGNELAGNGSGVFVMRGSPAPRREHDQRREGRPRTRQRRRDAGPARQHDLRERDEPQPHLRGRDAGDRRRRDLSGRAGERTASRTAASVRSWSGRRDSNPRRRTWKVRTLPTELLPLARR